jgi:hypothetical protein
MTSIYWILIPWICYRIINDNEFSEKFDLVEHNQTFEVYTKAILKCK